MAGGGDAGYEDAARIDMPFLPGYAGLREERNAFTHPGTLSPFSLVDAEPKKIKWVWLRSLALSAGRPRGRARRKRQRGGETRLRFPGPKPSVLANERRRCPTRFAGRRRGCPDTGAECDGQAKTACWSFLIFHRIKAHLMNILS